MLDTIILRFNLALSWITNHSNVCHVVCYQLVEVSSKQQLEATEPTAASHNEPEETQTEEIEQEEEVCLILGDPDDADDDDVPQASLSKKLCEDIPAQQNTDKKGTSDDATPVS